MKNEPPFFSVIVIFYNAERFLREAVSSVLSQIEESWELLLVDDGSTDSSASIAREYARQFPTQIYYIQHSDHRNHGMSATRNLGIRNSHGQWIAFLDADDVWLPAKLSEQKALILSNPEAGLLYGSPLYWFSWSSELSQFRDAQPGISVPPNTVVRPPSLMLLNYPLGKGPAPCPSDLAVRRTVLDRVGGFEESFGGIYQMYEDQAFLAKVYLTVPVLVSEQCWTRYRQSLNSCTFTTIDSGSYNKVRQFFLNYLEWYLVAHRHQDPLVWRALEQAKWPYQHPYVTQIADLYRRGLRRLRIGS